jgi:hypothetical protein
VLVHFVLYLRDHRSTTLLVLAAAVGAAALGGIAAALGVAFRLTPDGLIRLRQRAARWQTAYAGVGLLVAFLFGVEMRPEWVYAHVALALGAGFVLGYDLLYAEARPLSFPWLIAAVLVVPVTLIRINALSVYPAYNINDEPWVLGWALSYARHGYFFDTIQYYGGADVQRFMLLVAWWMRLVGTGFWQVRLFFFLLIFPLIALTARAAHNQYGAGAGWIAALVAFCSAVMMGGARIRHDIGLALALAAALCLYSEAVKRHQKRLHFVAGLAMGLGGFAHYHAVLFGVALGIALYLPGYVERWRQGKRLPEAEVWLFALGGLAGGAAVLLLEIVPDWEGFLAVRRLRSPVTLDGLVAAFLSYWRGITAYSQLEFVLVLAALATALWRRRRVDVQLALLVVLLHVALAVQATEVYPQYVLQISPVYALLIAGMFVQGFGGKKIAYAGVAAAAFMLINLGLTLQTPLAHLLARAPLELPTPPVAAWIREHVDPAQSVVTEHWYYLFLTDYDFISPLSPDYAPLAIQQESKEAIWDQIAPDVVVIDRNLSTCCVQQPIYDADYLRTRGYVEVAELPGERYPVLVYEKGSSE